MGKARFANDRVEAMEATKKYRPTDTSNMFSVVTHMPGLGVTTGELSESFVGS